MIVTSVRLEIANQSGFRPRAVICSYVDGGTHVTDVLISYARFVEVRARRLDIAAELLESDAQRATNVTMPSAPVANDAGPHVRVRVLGTGQRADLDSHEYASVSKPSDRASARRILLIHGKKISTLRDLLPLLELERVAQSGQPSLILSSPKI
jgi:hypothetical protein